jgi:hypothetical protein
MGHLGLLLLKQMKELSQSHLLAQEQYLQVLLLESQVHSSISFFPFLINGFFGKKKVTNRPKKKLPSKMKPPPPI